MSNFIDFLINYIIASFNYSIYGEFYTNFYNLYCLDIFNCKLYKYIIYVSKIKNLIYFLIL